MQSKVYKNISLLKNVKITIVHNEFPSDNEDYEELRKDYNDAICIAFLDYKGIFTRSTADKLSVLFFYKFIRNKDILIITSSVSERKFNSKEWERINWVQKNKKLCKYYYPDSESASDKIYFYIESRLNSMLGSKYTWETSAENIYYKSLIPVFRSIYNDTSRMGLWCFEAVNCRWPVPTIPIIEFENYVNLGAGQSELLRIEYKNIIKRKMLSRKNISINNNLNKRDQKKCKVRLTH